MPTGALSDEILYEGPERIRVLICLGSNPIAAWPDQLKTIRAMEKLELLVCLDMKMAATAKMADYVIAPKLSLEVPGLSVSSEAIEQTYVAHGYPEPYAQYSPALVCPPPGSDVIEEWEFFYGLAKRMDFQLNCYPIRPEAGVLRESRELYPVDMEKQPSTDELLEGIMNGSRVPLAELKRHPHGKIFDDETVVVGPADLDCEDRLDVGNPDMLAELAAIRAEAYDSVRGEDEAAGRHFQLVSRRMPNVYNSSGRDIDPLQRGKRYNPAYLHPEDLEMLGLENGDVVAITSNHASILGIVEAAPELRRGIVSMAHCFGDVPKHDQEIREIGSSTGRLIDNERDFDPHTGIPRMSAIPVAIRRA
jgi:anaerobic selenocysteine-containing dehydrogenase